MVDNAKLEIWGIPLDNDIADTPTWQRVGFAILLVILLIKPNFTKHYYLAASFWGIIVGLSLGYLVEVTWIPLLTTIVNTRTTYPYLVVIPHCIAANASYRAANGDKADRLRALIMGFFLYGFGGSIVSDILLGLPATALAHPRIVPCHFLGWSLIWFSPQDWVFTTLTRPDSFFHYFIVAAEAVDAVTTPMGRIARGARELHNKATAPIMGGLFAGIGGAIVRWLSGERGATFTAVQAGFYKTMGYSLLFWAVAVYPCTNVLDPNSDAHSYNYNHCSTFSGNDLFRVAIVGGHVVWTLLCDIGFVSSHPFIWLSQRVFHGKFGSVLVSTVRLGPQLQDEGSVGHVKKD